MDESQKRKLERYFKNSSRFLWGIVHGNQKNNYDWLRAKSFEFNDGTYSKVTNQLLERYGIEQIIKRLVIPRVKEMFTNKAIDYLRDSWQAGTNPDLSVLRFYNIDTPAPFLELNTQFDFVERWGELAGVWFEEIEQIEEFREMIK